MTAVRSRRLPGLHDSVNGSFKSCPNSGLWAKSITQNS